LLWSGALGYAHAAAGRTATRHDAGSARIPRRRRCVLRHNAPRRGPTAPRQTRSFPKPAAAMHRQTHRPANGWPPSLFPSGIGMPFFRWLGLRIDDVLRQHAPLGAHPRSSLLWRSMQAVPAGLHLLHRNRGALRFRRPLRCRAHWGSGAREHQEPCAQSEDKRTYTAAIARGGAVPCCRGLVGARVAVESLGTQHAAARSTTRRERG